MYNFIRVILVYKIGLTNTRISIFNKILHLCIKLIHYVRHL